MEFLTDKNTSRGFEVDHKRNSIKDHHVYRLVKENIETWEIELKYANVARYYTRNTGRGEKTRDVCKKCLVIDMHGWREVAYYLVNVYVKLKGKFHTLGKYCPNCGSFEKR